MLRRDRRIQSRKVSCLSAPKWNAADLSNYIFQVKCLCCDLPASLYNIQLFFFFFFTPSLKLFTTVLPLQMLNDANEKIFISIRNRISEGIVLTVLWLYSKAQQMRKSACGSFVDRVMRRQCHRPLYRQLMGLLCCYILVGPQALLFALGAGNIHQAVEGSVRQCS